MIALGVVDLPRACNYAARVVAAHPASVLRFLLDWDRDAESNLALFRQLQELWQERLADADGVQEVLKSECREVENQT
jgi:hypothetical protein